MDQTFPSHPAVLDAWQEFREARRDGIYSTDSPAILGLSRYATAITVWREKVEGVAPQGPMSIQAWLGLELEDTLAGLYHERYPDRQPARPPIQLATVTMEQHELIKTHIDFVVHEDLLLECKTRTRRSTEWGPDESSKVPVDIWVQCQHEMAVTGAELCDVAVLFGLHTFHVYHLQRDDAFIAELVPKLEEFWAHYVIPGVVPPISAHPADTAWAKRWEQSEPGLRAATPEQTELIKEYRLARWNSKQAEAARTKLENSIRDMIGPAEGITGEFGTITYRKRRDSTKTEWAKVAEAYHGMVSALLELANPGDDDRAVMLLATIQAQFPLVADLYTRVEPGPRVLDVKLKEEDTDDD